MKEVCLAVGGFGKERGWDAPTKSAACPASHLSHLRAWGETSRTARELYPGENPAIRGAWSMVLACFFSAAAGFNAPGAWVRHGITASYSLSGPALTPRLIGAPLMKLPGFGLNDREMARLSQMKRRDEPLEEKVRGL